jgi:hypothetical protein
MKQPAKHYQDFVIAAPTAPLYWIRPVAWLKNKLGKPARSGRYYGTTVRRVGKTKIEVTFDLPPSIKKQMHNAIEAGKQIRLFVL